jgi:hypothetical protein
MIPAQLVGSATVRIGETVGGGADVVDVGNGHRLAVVGGADATR